MNPRFKRTYPGDQRTVTKAFSYTLGRIYGYERGYPSLLPFQREVADRIHITARVPAAAANAIAAHRDLVQGETLAMSLSVGEAAPSGTVSEAKLLDETVTIGIARAA